MGRKKKIIVFHPSPFPMMRIPPPPPKSCCGVWKLKYHSWCCFYIKKWSWNVKWEKKCFDSVLVSDLLKFLNTPLNCTLVVEVLAKRKPKMNMLEKEKGQEDVGFFYRLENEGGRGGGGQLRKLTTFLLLHWWRSTDIPFFVPVVHSNPLKRKMSGADKSSHLSGIPT